jgi:hypothetical protein
VKWILALLFGVGGLAVLAAGIAVGLERYKLFRGGTHAQGRVVEQIRTETKKDPFAADHPGFHTEQTNRTVVTYHPVVEFQTAGGEKRRFQDTGGSQNPLELATGTAVDVLYDSGNPASARIETLSQMALQPLFMIAAGILLCVLGVKGFFGD